MILCMLFSLPMQECEGDQASLKDETTFWRPAATVNELYRQISSKKYREIARQQVE